MAQVSGEFQEELMPTFLLFVLLHGPYRYGSFKFCVRRCQLLTSREGEHSADSAELPKSTHFQTNWIEPQFKIMSLSLSTVFHDACGIYRCAAYIMADQ